ncbi:MAG: hypothetical protein ACXVHB_33735, partial [Solirubrobacteraceae bacterium]
PQHPPRLAAQPLSARPLATTAERHARVTLPGGPGDDEIDRVRSGLALPLVLGQEAAPSALRVEEDVAMGGL